MIIERDGGIGYELWNFVLQLFGGSRVHEEVGGGPQRGAQWLGAPGAVEGRLDCARTGGAGQVIKLDYQAGREP